MLCVFCTDAAASGEILFEDAEAWIIIHHDWAVAGHTMVVSKTHAENVADLDPDAWLRLAAVWQRTERALLEATGAERIIVLKLGLQTPHLHIHLYPVSGSATRAEVFATIDAVTRTERDPVLVETLRLTLSRR